MGHHHLLLGDSQRVLAFYKIWEILSWKKMTHATANWCGQGLNFLGNIKQWRSEHLPIYIRRRLYQPSHLCLLPLIICPAWLTLPCRDLLSGPLVSSLLWDLLLLAQLCNSLSHFLSPELWMPSLRPDYFALSPNQDISLPDLKSPLKNKQHHT